MKKISLLFASILFSINALAITPQEKEFLVKIQKTYPDLQVEDAVYLPEVKLYELHMKNQSSVAFTNSNLDYFYSSGELLDPKNKKSISAQREAINTQKFFNKLPTDKAIVVKYGKGTRKVAVFTDPDCPYCKATDIEIHNRLKKEDITFYYYMNPLRIPGHEEAPLKAKKIWCSSNKSKAWVDWMVNNKLPTNNGTCKNPVDETKALSDSYGFNSTPIIIYDNGLIWNGAAKAEDIMKGLNARQVVNGLR